METLPIAFLVHENTRYEVNHGYPFTQTQTPITRLIEGICSIYPADSRRILRERIYTRVPLSPICRGMIRLAAKRVSVLSDEAFGSTYNSSRFIRTESILPISVEKESQSEIRQREFKNLNEAARYALSLKEKSARGIAVLLLDKNHRLISEAWNTNLEIRTQHAELNLIRSLEQSGLSCFPKGSQLIVSLRPCAMCAAAILLFSDPAHPPTLFFIEDDLGPKAKNSVLVKGSELWISAGKPDLEITELQLRV